MPSGNVATVHVKLAPDVFDIARLRIEPGDILVVRTEQRMSSAQRAGFLEMVSDTLADESGVLFIGGGEEILVISKEEKEAECE